MQQAWAQLGDLLQANQKIRQLQLADEHVRQRIGSTSCRNRRDQSCRSRMPVHARVPAARRRSPRQVKRAACRAPRSIPAFRKIARPRGRDHAKGRCGRQRVRQARQVIAAASMHRAHLERRATCCRSRAAVSSRSTRIAPAIVTDLPRGRIVLAQTLAGSHAIVAYRTPTQSQRDVRSLGGPFLGVLLANRGNRLPPAGRHSRQRRGRPVSARRVNRPVTTMRSHARHRRRRRPPVSLDADQRR